MKLKDLIHLIDEIDDMEDEFRHAPVGTVKNGPSTRIRIAGRKVRLKTVLEIEE